MRRAGVLIAVMVAASFALGCGELMAKTQPTAVVSGMTDRPDIAQLQAAALDWLQATVTSSQFVFGVIVGLVFAEGGRFMLRWLGKTLAAVVNVGRLVAHYRLMTAGALAAAYYVAVYVAPSLGSLPRVFG